MLSFELVVHTGYDGEEGGHMKKSRQLQGTDAGCTYYIFSAMLAYLNTHT